MSKREKRGRQGLVEIELAQEKASRRTRRCRHIEKWVILEGVSCDHRG